MQVTTVVSGGPEDGLVALDPQRIYALAEGLGSPDAARLALGAVTAAKRMIGPAATSATTRQARRELDALVERVFLAADLAISAEPSPSRIASSLLVTVLEGTRAHVYTVGGGKAWLARGGLLQRINRARPEQVLGAGEAVDVDVVETLLADGDVVVLATRAFAAEVGEAALTTAFQAADPTPEGFVARTRALAGAVPGLCALRVRIEEKSSAVAMAELLARAALFRELTVAQRLAVMPYLDERVVRAGEVLIREGDAGDEFFALLLGTLRVTRGGATIRDLATGDTLGELALAPGNIGGVRSATVTAVTECRVIAMAADRFAALVERRPEIGVKMLSAILASMAARMRDLTDRVAAGGP
jgi:CRP/FNR family cyclic AMP-dependent transcriptional regulator